MSGRKANKGDSKSFQVTVPLRLYDYLTYLTQHTGIGSSENEVASYILRAKLIELAQSKFHELDIPALPDA